MKLLGWMHRKLKQNGNEPFKDFGLGHACNCLIGQASLEEEQFFPKPSNYGTRTALRHEHVKSHLRRSFAGLESASNEEEEEEYFYEESAITDIFHGFLAIGTLGSSDPINTESSTPTFVISVDNITEKETEVTENELKLINDELEKVLAVEAREEYFTDTMSGRNSHVSAGRSSNGSTITLSGKAIESQGQETNNANGTAICPLQGYLFGSAVETTVAKKENRTSLAELFQRTKMCEENKCEREEKQKETTDKSVVVNLMKKVLKKKLIHASSSLSTTSNPRSSTSSGGSGTADSASAEKKLHKILQMFHRKVHPETSTSARKKNKPHKKGTAAFNDEEHENYGGEQQQIIMSADEEIMFPPKHGLMCYKSQCNPPELMLSGSSSDSNGSSRECWIKTDADYLVLEL